jgi:hypothetical protein
MDRRVRIRRHVSYGMQGTYTNSDAVPTSFTLTANNGQTVTCATG